LITNRFPFANAGAAYETLRLGRALGIVLDYGGPVGETNRAESNLLAREVFLRASGPAPDGPRVALLGAGNFAVRTLLPALQRQRASLEAVVSNQGSAALFAAQKFGAAWAGTDEARLWSDPKLDAVIITTRHEAHAEQATAALTAGKHVWVEKPLAISAVDLGRIRDAYQRLAVGPAGRGPVLMVGFNRRFAPIATTLRAALARRGRPLEVRMTINAGRLESDHWALNREVGGGRIVGEGCHFIDLARFLVGATLASARCLRRDANGQDGGCFSLRFSDGSQARIDYRTDLPAHVPKEMIEVSGPGFSAVIHNWSRLRSQGLGGIRQGGFWSLAPRKGHAEAIAAFLGAIRGGPPPIPPDVILEVSAWAIALQRMLEGEEIRGE